MTTHVRGTVAPGFDGVREAFEAAFDSKPHMGAALAIFHRGEPVVDLWGGVADDRHATLWQRNTASVIFSCTKGLLSILAARLVEENRLDYHAPVAEYWPEFAQEGKATVLVRDILAHRSGLSAPRRVLTRADVLDWESVTTALAEQTPLWEPGTAHAYHALTHGWLIGEVIRRITGRKVGRYFAEAIADPLGVDAWIGLPESMDERIAHLRVGPSLAELVREQAEARVPGVPDWPDLALTLGGAFPPELAGPHSGFNDPLIRVAGIPGAGAIATARALAAIWSATITDTDGVRLLNDSTLRRALEVQTEGAPVFDTPRPWPRWGMGFQLDSESRRYVTNRGFGHDGAGGQVAFADPAVGVGFAFLTNQLEAIPDTRATWIVDALRHILAADVTATTITQPPV
jgi:CubicO group peptidase (beta-lactamase class C family)